MTRHDIPRGVSSKTQHNTTFVMFLAIRSDTTRHPNLRTRRTLPASQPAKSQASGMAGWASGLAGWPRGGEWMDGRTDGRTKERKISPFYRTLSPIGAAALPPPMKTKEKVEQVKGTADHLMPLCDWLQLKMAHQVRKG